MHLVSKLLHKVLKDRRDKLIFLKQILKTQFWILNVPPHLTALTLSIEQLTEVAITTGIQNWERQ